MFVGKLRAKPFLDLRGKVSKDVEQGLLSMAFHPKYVAEPQVLRLYTGERRDSIVEYRARNFVADPEARGGSSRSKHSRAEPQRRTAGVRARRTVVFRARRRRWQGGPEQPLAVTPLADGQALPDRRQPADSARADDGFGLRTRGASPSTGRPATSTSATSARTPGRRSTSHRGEPGLENYGWRVYEGDTRNTNEEPNPAGALIPPVHVYGRAGGRRHRRLVYRGRAVPEARGRYFFGDFASGRVWTIVVDQGLVTEYRREPFSIGGLASFAEGPRGELYAVSIFGAIYRLVR